MSGEVPVCDVLLEAAEYLCKLGGNLKIRSENLKEKRITKDKLRNTHAVQKAADKLLLICDLSKKSLSNVELGVRKILSVCGVSANSQPSKSTTSSPKKLDQPYIIKYGSRRLKIKQKVNFQHYESVKVFAKRMPVEMQEKYPVYYDCKMYRQRKKKATLKKDDAFISLNKDVAKKDDSNVEKDNTQTDDSKLLGKMKKGIDSDNEIISSPKKDSGSLEKSSSNSRKTSLDSIQLNSKENTALDSEVEEKVKEKMKKEKNLDGRSKSRTKSKESRPKSIECESISDEDNRKVIPVKKVSVESDNGRKKESKSKDVKGNKLSDSDLTDEEDKSARSKSIEKTDHDTEKVHNNIERKKLKRIKFLDNCSSSDDNKPLSYETRKDIDPEPITVRKISSAPEITSENSNMNNENNINKPLLKCIDLTKLLKPEVVKKIHKSEKSKMSKENKDAQKFYRSDEAILDDKKYWEEKRKEVSAFKPKQFIISVTKLPEFSQDFLSRHNLKRITQNEKILAEISCVKADKLDTNSVEDKDEPFDEEKDSCTVKGKNKKEKSSKMLLKPDISKAKSALLDDSDSEKQDRQSSSSPTSPIADAEKIKHALLHDSDSDKNNEEVESEVVHKETEKLIDDEKSMEKDNVESKQNKSQQESSSPSDKQTGDDVEKLEERIENSKDDAVNVKTSLLKDSSDDGPKTPSNKRKNSEASTPPSKRKRMMESIKAKRMLMTYSSSSDTEDEQLRNALKEIKDSLLEVSSDEQSKSIIERMRAKRKKLMSSSSDDEKSDEQIKKVKSMAKKKCKQIKKQVSEEDSSQAGQDEDNSTISQVDGNMDEMSNSSSKMGRSKVKSNASSSQNSDTQETDKDIDGLTNLKTLAPRRRKDSSSTSREERPRTRAARMPKAPAISDDVILEADSNSSAEESAADDGEELPPVTVTGLNGGGALEHLAKDDLLDESDASSSQNKSSEDNNKDDESADDENVKSKRRKAPAISSDSEGGSRQKDPAVRLTDFEDSDADSSELGKRSKRKKKGSDSDASGGSDDGGKKKRRRIKHVDDTDASGSESETEGQKRGRKNIRKVMGKDQLEEATKKAAREERERLARIVERQRLYNNLQFDESGKPDEVVLDKVVLDFDPETKEPLIQVDPGLVKKLKPHQANGIKFMWDACFESAKRSKKDKGSGCILAHCMGLGKTLQVVSLTHTLLTHGKLTGVRRVLVVCPLSTVLNWVNEFNMWLKHANADFDVDVYELSRFKQNSERAFQLQQWLDNGGVCVLGYEMFRNLSADNTKKYRKKMLQTFQKSLVDPGPDLVVCDEGHLLKNEKTSLSQSMNRVKTLRRIVLTGTPLQNNLKEYYCMVQFVKPNLLGKYNEYLNRFVNPITNGQYTDSTDHDIRIMKRRSHVLHKMLDGAVQRRDYGVLAPFLPPKHEYVLFITLTDIQAKLYQFYLDNYSRRPLPGKSSGFLFPDFQSLQRIWTHPLVLKYNSERYEIMQQKKRDKEEEEDSEGSLADFIDDESTPPESSTEESSDDLSDASDDSRKKMKKKKSSKKAKRESKASSRRATRANPVELDAEEKALSDIEEVKNENPTEWWIKLVNDEELDDLRNSHKLLLLFEILRQCEAIGDKLLVFSQSLYSLDLIEHFLGKIDEATQEGRIDEKLGSHVGSWSPGIDYFRLDGSTSCENRSIWCKNFNREDNPRARLFLISTRAGGLGINLVAANRVVIFDVSWNPSHDVQSIFRVYRFGQKKPCYIYRFLAMGTMEEKIYERQVTKQAISKRVIDEQQIDRHYAENDLAELYKFEPRPPEPRELPPLPKDRLFAEMLKDHETQIYKYHEHDSLLENKEEETLTEEERKAAWEDFENEKTRPPPAPFPNMWPMHANGMSAGLMAQQQQQLAYAALSAMLRKDMPNINDNQIRDMLPLIYQANPALMQKMSEIYKYAQPGMANPMMGPFMNAGKSAASAGAGGMGGSSGLQYEPPWQRQQQQQNQLRMQQLMQQQNSMGAKYYAGGLGSRDPVAMAMQQARAREIMLGESTGRPRGRPPLARPPPAPADVVNLDSD